MIVDEEKEGKPVFVRLISCCRETARVYWLGILCAAACLLPALPSHANNVAVVVGTSDYRNAALPDLQFADEDARLFTQTLVQSLHYKKTDIRLLTSRPQAGEWEATAANITKAIGEMARKQADPTQSTFLFFASAHGVETTEGAMLAAKDYNPKQPIEGAQAELTAVKLTRRLAGLKSGLVVAMFDICRKDGLIRSERRRQRDFVLPQGNARRVATLFSSVEGPSFESAKLKHGCFSYYVCRGLSKRESKKNKQAIVGALDETVDAVTLKSLYDYVRWNLMEETRSLPEASKRGTAIAAKGQAEFATLAHFIAVSVSGQLPELVCGETVRQEVLVRYEQGTCRAEVSGADQFTILRNQGLDAFLEKNYSEAGVLFARACRIKTDAVSAMIAGLCFSLAGDKDKARIWFKHSLEAEPRNSAAMMFLSFMGGSRQEQDDWLRKALAADPDNTDLLVLQSYMALYRGNGTDTENLLRKALERMPKNIRIMGGMSFLFVARNQWKEAESWLRNALQIAPNDAETMVRLGELQNYQGNWKDAQDWFHRVLEIAPLNTEAMLALSRISQRKKEGKVAENWLRKALKAEPDNAKIMVALGDLCMDLEKRKEARGWYQKALDAGIFEADEVHNKMFRLLGGSGRTLEAYAVYHKVLEAHPDNVNALLELGRNFTYLDKAQAERWLWKAFEASPKNVKVKLAFGKFFAAHKEWDEAETWYRRAIAAYPESIEPMRELGDVFEKQERWIQAERWYRKALETDPANIDALTSDLVGVMKKQKKEKEISVLYRHLLDAEPWNSEAMVKLGDISREEGNREQAEAYYSNALESNPRNVEAIRGLIELAEHWRQQGDGKKTEALYRKALEGEPKDMGWLAPLVTTLKSYNREKEAENWLRRVIDVAPWNTQAMAALAEIAAEEGKEAEAEHWYHKMLEKEPRNRYVVEYQVVPFLKKQGKGLQVENWLRKTLESDPTNTVVMIELGKWFREQNKLETAAAWYRKALASDLEQPSWMVELGDILEASGNVHEASEWLIKAYRHEPEYGFHLRLMCWRLETKGRLNEAIAVYREMIAAKPDDALSLANLANLLWKSNRKDEARIEAKKAQEMGLEAHEVFKKLGLKMP